ncbi:MAG: HD-GYP domain-containing protein [Bacillota bacterium]
MRRVPVTALVPGMRIAREVVGGHGEVYLQTGVILTQGYIRKLGELGFASVYVHDALLGDLQVRQAEDIVHHETRREALDGVKTLLQEAAESQAKAIDPPKELTRTVSDMVDQVLKNPSQTINIYDIRAQNEYLYHHSVNVCALALVIGAQIGLSRRELYELGVGALMHDVGKIKVPAEILDKPGKLSAVEFELVKKHALLAEELLKDNAIAAAVAGMHHERLNGEGYPRGLKKGEIPHLAQIVGIADIFDALTADRCYRKAYRPDEALEMLLAAGGFWFDFDLVRAFVVNVAAYPVGTMVELNSGEIGAVVSTPKGFPTQPVVRVFVAVDGGWLGDAYDVSTLEKCLFVTRVLDEEEISFIKKKILGSRQSTV